MSIDVDASELTGKLVKTFQKGGKQYGVLEYTGSIAIKSLGAKSPLKLKAGSAMGLKMVGEACIDGTNPSSKMTGTLSIKMDGEGVALQILVASVPEFRLYEFGRVTRPFTALFGILEEVGAAGRTVRTAPAKRRRTPTASDAAGYFTSVVERLDRRDWYSRNKLSRSATAERKSKSRASSRSMLFQFLWQAKQWARLFRGFTVANISPHFGHRKKNRPSRIFDGGPSRPRAAIVTRIGKSLRSRRSRSAGNMNFSVSEVREVNNP